VVKGPVILDDFGDVYGAYLALTGDGYLYQDLKDIADNLKKQRILVPGVKKIAIGGEQPEVVYVEISRTRMREMGISPEQIAGILQSQNVVEDAGHVAVGGNYVRIQVSDEFISATEVGNLLVGSKGKQLIYLRDITSIQRAYEEVPSKLIYFNGKPSLTMAISMSPGANVVAVGEAVNNRLRELQSMVPLGMKLGVIYDQPAEVINSVKGFLVSVGQALAIIIAVLLLFMGFTSGMIIGTVLLITVAGTLFIMELFGIELQRVLLGAMVIALGMLLDNAIVVAEGMMVRIQGGMNTKKAASEVVAKIIWALLGGTIIGILAFSAIALSKNNTGKLAGSLFYVILIPIHHSFS